MVEPIEGVEKPSEPEGTPESEMIDPEKVKVTWEAIRKSPWTVIKAIFEAISIGW